MSNKWSGLAPAVNAHLARWAKIDEEWKRIQRMTERQDGKQVWPMGSNAYPESMRWTAFAKSWGLPNDGGEVTQVLGGEVTDRESDSPMHWTETHDDGTVSQSNRDLLITDGHTIHGREQEWDLLSEHRQLTTAVTAVELMGREERMLTLGETMYVSGDILDMVTDAASVIDPEPLFWTDLPTPAGLMIFEHPLIISDMHPDTGEVIEDLRCAIRAIGWAPHSAIMSSQALYEQGLLGKDAPEGDLRATVPMPARAGVLLYMYSTPDDWRDSYLRDWRRLKEAGRLSYLREAEGEPGMMGARDALIPLDVSPWSFGSSWQIYNGVVHQPGHVDKIVADERKFFLTMMRFTWQRLLRNYREPLSAKATKRLNPLFKRKPGHEYSVLRLRRIDVVGKPESGMGMALGYRQKVRGYWMRVHVKSMGPARLEDGQMDPNTHRLTWIEAHWRGPVDGDIGPLHKATTVVR